MKSAINIIIRMVIVIGVLLILAFDKFPKDNEYVSQQNFLLALTLFAFLYYFAQLSRAPVDQQEK